MCEKRSDLPVGESLEKEIDNICIRMADSVCCTAETNT